MPDAAAQMLAFVAMVAGRRVSAPPRSGSSADFDSLARSPMAWKHPDAELTLLRFVHSSHEFLIILFVVGVGLTPARRRQPGDEGRVKPAPPLYHSRMNRANVGVLNAMHRAWNQL